MNSGPWAKCTLGARRIIDFDPATITYDRPFELCSFATLPSCLTSSTLLTLSMFWHCEGGTRAYHFGSARIVADSLRSTTP